MKPITTAATALLAIAIAGLAPIQQNARSQENAPEQPVPPSIPAGLTREEVLNACIQERAESLPQLYSDVPPTHWAYTAVQTMAYCGAYRSATPPSLIEKLLRSDSDESPLLGGDKPPFSSP
ncbi:MAG: S-layer protein [Oscillatoria sp. SIO1A7]|nr:S-layer protein [Oscillatoria sp. SIO1A7]